jgi:hypothetical protein
MTSTVSGEFSAEDIMQRLASGSYPRDFTLTAARGFLPLAQDDLITVLAYLCSTDDGEVSTAARGSLSDIPTRVLVGYAQNEGNDPAHLDLLARATADATLLESIVRNRTTMDDTVLELARRADPATQEVIVINQARILRRPEILDALLENPKLSNESRRRALENREEFFEKRARVQQQAAEDAAAAAEAAAFEAEQEAILADLLAKAALENQNEQTLPELSPNETSDPDKVSVYSKVQGMNVAEKVKLAFRGAKTERSLLIRDRNRLVASAVMRNARMTPQEVETIAGMRNVDDEVLRLISVGRGWMNKYPIVLSLARNPKAPIGVVLPLINRLTLKDLKTLMSDKNVSETTRQQARKLFQMRSKKSG